MPVLNFFFQFKAGTGKSARPPILMSRIAIIGAGPIGLEAALLARQLGHDVQVVEKGRVAENVLDWGHVRLFSPFGMNSSEWGRGALAKAFGHDSLPGDDELLTGCEFAERYLIPLSRLPELTARIHEQTQVQSISRRHFRKTDAIGSAARAREPFQLLVEQEGVQRVELADVVLDCSGTYPRHQWVGDGGMPCLGERHSLTETNYRLPVIRREEFGNRTTLVIGSGFSAATSVVKLAELAKLDPQTKVFWLAKSQPQPHETDGGPLPRTPNDPLAERDRLAAKANELASLGHVSHAASPEAQRHPVVWFPNAVVKSLKSTPTCHDFNGFEVELDDSRVAGQGSDWPARLTVDRIIANVGFRPDRSIYEELHVHECYATQGPIKLAAKLLGETSLDCLAQTSHSADVLKNPEPNFFILGSKSYGRNSNFLLRVGHTQIEAVFNMLEDRP